MKPDFVRMARDMADEVTKRPGDGIAALAVMSAALRAAYAAGLERAAEIASAWRNERGHESVAIIEVVERIRAEKENDNG
jgi:hypothetical protein